jgi:hypothetical protein
VFGVVSFTYNVTGLMENMLRKCAEHVQNVQNMLEMRIERCGKMVGKDGYAL